ncbi:MAG: hypothetical protein AAF555_05685 [Verrucomicrobiota bacterium]
MTTDFQEITGITGDGNYEFSNVSNQAGGLLLLGIQGVPDGATLQLEYSVDNGSTWYPYSGGIYTDTYTGRFESLGMNRVVVSSAGASTNITLQLRRIYTHLI